MGDPRPAGRDAVAIVTALLPVYEAHDDVAAELAWTRMMPTLVSIMKDMERQELVTLVGHLGHIAADLIMRINPEHPYEVVQELAKNHE